MGNIDIGDLCASFDRARLMESSYAKALSAKRCGNLRQYFDGIRRVHSLNASEVAAGNYDPYVVDWTLLFTPIERDAWFSIRTFGLRMFPQFPVDRYFVDFGDPWSKVAIECDGRQWHDAKKDAARDERITACGWEVIRLKGSDLWKDEDDPEAAHHAIRSIASLRRWHVI